MDQSNFFFFLLLLVLFSSLFPFFLSRATLSDKQKLQMYALFKQITVGPCKEKVHEKVQGFLLTSIEKAPSSLRFVAKAKHDAWSKLGNMSKKAAIETYLKLIDEVS